MSKDPENLKIRGELLLKALEIIEKFAYGTADFIEDFLSSSKSDYRALRNYQPKEHKTVAEGIREKLLEEEKTRLERLRGKKRARNFVYRLKRDGLIKKIVKNGKEGWGITPKGQRKKQKIKTSIDSQLPRKNYAAEKSNELIIISFDIPEKERRKRDWLRSILTNLGFRMMQKSVWIGKIKIPQELIKDFKKNNLLGCIEIFAISKTGTIKHIA